MYQTNSSKITDPKSKILNFRSLFCKKAPQKKTSYEFQKSWFGTELHPIISVFNFDEFSSFEYKGLGKPVLAEVIDPV